MNPITLSYANMRGEAHNISYPFRKQITDYASLADVVSHDHVCGLFADGKSGGEIVQSYRSKESFISTDVVAMDCDNSDSSPDEWETLETLATKLPGVSFCLVPSRHNMLSKGGETARPRFHIYFPLSVPISNAEEVGYLKRKIFGVVRTFDENALDAARFFYGVENPKPQIVEGVLCIDEFLRSKEVLHTADTQRALDMIGSPIPEGVRNETMHRYALRTLKRLGNSDASHDAFLKRANDCCPPLPDSELQSIWRSALQFFEKNILTDPAYIPAESFETTDRLTDLSITSYQPQDYTDIGQARLLCKVYGDSLRYSKSLGWLYYDGVVWRENNIAAQQLSQQLTELQLSEVRRRILASQKASNDAAEAEDRGRKSAAESQLQKDMAYRSFVLSRRKSAGISATLTETRPMLAIDVSELDVDPYLLNTPNGAVDLVTGKIRSNCAEDLCTRMTSVAPSHDGYDQWEEFLDQITCSDGDLKRYLQEIAGMFLVGKVLSENLVIATGKGGNGKSTLFNLMLKVLGSYGGMIASDALMANSRRNKMPELAALRGKRLVVAAELDEGQRLDAGQMKKIVSTDRIHAEPKFKDPFDFEPSHTTVLFTNFLPKVGSNDKGTWDRIIVIPFNASFRGQKQEVLNYADVLFKSCGGAVLSWMIEGAKRLNASGGKIVQPDCVKDAIAEYRADNDWLKNFFDACLTADNSALTGSSELYDTYIAYCTRMNEFHRNPHDFKVALEAAGFESKRMKSGVFFKGVKVSEPGSGYMFNRMALS